MTHDSSNPPEPNFTDSQPTDPQTPEAQTPEAQTSDPQTSESSEPSSLPESGTDLPPEVSDTASAEPIESVAMTDTTQHSTISEAPESSNTPSTDRSSDATPEVPSDKMQQDATPSGNTSPPSATGSESASKPAVIVQLLKQVWVIVLALAPVIVGIGRTLWRLLKLLASWIWKGWQFLLPRIRTVLPEGWNKLPDWTITAVAVLLLTLVLWITTLLLPTKAPARLGDRPPAVSAPSSPQAKPTPDPALITKIQEQVASVADDYTAGLIQSVQANFGSSQLTVKLGDGWYDLASVRQDGLANDILKRSRRLDFHSLQLTDVEGDLLARSPVVGEKMVIYRRVRSEPGESSVRP